MDFEAINDWLVIFMIPPPTFSSYFVQNTHFATIYWSTQKLKRIHFFLIFRRLHVNEATNCKWIALWMTEIGLVFLTRCLPVIMKMLGFRKKKIIENREKIFNAKYNCYHLKHDRGAHSSNCHHSPMYTYTRLDTCVCLPCIRRIYLCACICVMK